jgi:hypothetical protein
MNIKIEMDLLYLVSPVDSYGMNLPFCINLDIEALRAALARLEKLKR